MVTEWILYLYLLSIYIIGNCVRHTFLNDPKWTRNEKIHLKMKKKFQKKRNFEKNKNFEKKSNNQKSKNEKILE